MTVNTNKTKVMIIKSKDTSANFVYDNNNLEEASSYNYLGIDIQITSSTRTIALRKGLRVLSRSWFHFLVPLKKSETHFRKVNQERICVIDGTFGITRAQTQG